MIRKPPCLFGKPSRYALPTSGQPLDMLCLLPDEIPGDHQPTSDNLRRHPAPLPDYIRRPPCPLLDYLRRHPARFRITSGDPLPCFRIISRDTLPTSGLPPETPVNHSSSGTITPATSLHSLTTGQVNFTSNTTLSSYSGQLHDRKCILEYYTANNHYADECPQFRTLETCKMHLQKLRQMHHLYKIPINHKWWYLHTTPFPLY